MMPNNANKERMTFAEPIFVVSSSTLIGGAIIEHLLMLLNQIPQVKEQNTPHVGARVALSRTATQPK